MTPNATWQSDIVPAQLSYLAIYNPTLGPTDETFDQQLVFYYGRVAAEARAQRKNGKSAENLREQSNEQLRQIGLAQGLVDFAKTFSNGEPVESVETEKSRIVLHQLEQGWWILASIDLTRLPAAGNAPKSAKSKEETVPQIEYSSREVSPPALLTQQIKHGHTIFSLHHGASLTALHSRLGRERFCSTLERFWTRFAKTWDVMLHGNPAVDVLEGIKLASGGELGFGVGEELWGSGERDVLEDFTRSTEGLVDTVVARYGEADAAQDALPWIGAGSLPTVSDGIVFGGINALTRPSLQSISLWMNHIYTYGDHAYGVKDNPSRERRRRRRRNISEQIGGAGQAENRWPLQRSRSSSRSIRPAQPVPAKKYHPTSTSDHGLPAQGHPGIPPPIVNAAEAALNAATRKAEQATPPVADQNTTMGIPDQYVKYLTLGLSTLVKPVQPELPQTPIPTTEEAGQTDSKDFKTDGREQDLSVLEPIPDGDAVQAKISLQKYHEKQGHFIIGLKGDLNLVSANEEAELTEGSVHDGPEGPRTVVRTLYVEVNRTANTRDDESDQTLRASPGSKLTRLRVLIYAHRPFIFCFLFEQRTHSLENTGFYQNVHKSLSTIYKPLLSSTQPSRIAGLIDDASSIKDTKVGDEDVYDLLFDPIRMTIHSSLPNIPEPGSLAAEGILSNARNKTATAWSRLDALNVHTAILNMLETARHNKHDLEKTGRTNRDWWIVWMRLPASDQSLESSRRKEREPDPKSRTAFIVRKANDAQTAAKPSTSSRAASGMWSSLALLSGTTATSASERVSMLPISGIGFDARKYVEGLLSLNR